MPHRVYDIEDLPKSLPSEVGRDIYCICATQEGVSWEDIEQIRHWLKRQTPHAPYSFFEERIEGGLFGVTWVEFDTEGLARYCQEWETPEGRSRDPRIQCYVLRYEDYVASVRRQVSECWGFDRLPVIDGRTAITWEPQLTSTQNRQRWLDLCRLRAIEGMETAIADLTPAEFQQLARLNEGLKDFEQWVQREATKLMDDGRIRLPLPKKYFRLGRLYAAVDYRLNERDPSFDPAGKISLFCSEDEIVELLRLAGGNSELVEPPGREADDVPPPPHCHLYRFLSYYSGLDLRDMLSIGEAHAELVYTACYRGPSLIDPLPQGDAGEGAIAQTAEERQYRRIQATLSEIQVGGLDVLIDHLTGRLANSEDPLDDFEIRVDISYRASESSSVAKAMLASTLVRRPGSPWIVEGTESLARGQDALESNGSSAAADVADGWLFRLLAGVCRMTGDELMRVGNIAVTVEVHLPRNVVLR